MGAGGKRFLCPHCCRAGGRLGGVVQGEMVCNLCVKDGRRVQQIVTLIYKAVPAARGSGNSTPYLMLELFIGWAKLKGLSEVMYEAKAVIEEWRTRDATDQSEVAARDGRYNG